MDFLSRFINELELELFRRSRLYDAQIKRIASIPGVTELSAPLSFQKSAPTCPFLNPTNTSVPGLGWLTPANNESASKKKATRCSMAGQYPKPLLIQCTLAATKSRKGPYFAIKYQRGAKKRGKKKAIIAVARMMLSCIYHMLTEGKDFRPNDHDAVIHPPKQKSVVLNLDNTLQFLREQGTDPETLRLIQQQCATQPA